MTQYDQDPPCSGTSMWNHHKHMVVLVRQEFQHLWLKLRTKTRTNISMSWSSESLAQEHAEIMFKPAGSAGMNAGVLSSNWTYNLGTTELRDGKIAKKTIQRFLWLWIWSHYEEIYGSFACFSCIISDMMYSQINHCVFQMIFISMFNLIVCCLLTELSIL